jgi:hypothetical protein
VGFWVFRREIATDESYKIVIKLKINNLPSADMFCTLLLLILLLLVVVVVVVVVAVTAAFHHIDLDNS